MIPSMLARTTTPWTLPSNMFLAVNTSIWYAGVYDCEKQALFIIAQEALDRIYPDKEAYHVLFVTS
jgi:isoleucyl-tRNA synthetase